MIESHRETVQKIRIQALYDEYPVAKLCVDTAENGPNVGRPRPPDYAF